MATFVKQPSGSWRAIVRRKGWYISETFALREDARSWATTCERRIDQGKPPQKTRVLGSKSFAHLIDLYLEDLQDVGRRIGRTKSANLELLKTDLGAKDYAQLDRKAIIDFGRARARGGAGPVTVSMYIGEIKTVFTHVSAVHDIDVQLEPIEKGRLALKHLGLVGKSEERDRRPTDDELRLLFDHFDHNPWQVIPMSRIIRFAIATAMRQDEICRVTWSDFDAKGKMLLIRDRKDPRRKYGNDQLIPLVDLSGYDPIELIEQQRAYRSNFDDRIFPFNGRSVSAAFTRATSALDIDDLVFHDTRHEATSRYFEGGLHIPEAALITGHKDWKMLQRYTHLRPQSIHDIVARLKARKEESP